jgi:hypothetical protein
MRKFADCDSSNEQWMFTQHLNTSLGSDLKSVVMFALQRREEESGQVLFSPEQPLPVACLSAVMLYSESAFTTFRA